MFTTSRVRERVGTASNFRDSIASRTGLEPMSDPPCILVVDDEQSYLDALSVALQREGFRVETASDGTEALARFEVPGATRGLESVGTPNQFVHCALGLLKTSLVLQDLRDGPAWTATDSMPPSVQDGSDAVDILEVGDVCLDAARHAVFVNGAPVGLPLKEFELLELLMANAGRVLTRDVLMDRIWGPNYFGDTKTLDVHVKRVRSKIESDPTNPSRIVTVRGVGYRYERPQGAVA